MIFLSASDDETQDREIGDLRGFTKSLVGTASVLEIGPSYSPLFPKREGFRASTVDHADSETLRAKYLAMNVDPAAIEDVDYVWRGGSIAQLVGGKKFDFLFCSHVVEHMTDFLRFLRDSEKIVGNDGKVALIVPDKRYCFDLFQPITDTAKVLSDYARNASIHSLESLYREESQVIASYEGVDRLAWWQGDVANATMFRNNTRKRFEAVFSDVRGDEYVDAHEYYFTPSSFLLLVKELRHLGLCGLEVEILSRSRGCEFLVIMGSAGEDSASGDFAPVRRELSLNIMREQIESWQKLIPLQAPLDASLF